MPDGCSRRTTRSPTATSSEIAGVEADDEVSVSTQRSDEYTGRFSRSEASEIVTVLREAQAPAPPFDPGEHTIGELEEELDTDENEKRDVDSLNALYRAERLGDDRTGAPRRDRGRARRRSRARRCRDRLESAGLTDMADFLTRFDPATVETAADVVNGDTEISELEVTDGSED